MKSIIAVALLASIVGCATVTEPTIADIPVPASITVRCPDLPLITVPTTMGDSLQYIVALQQQYIDCALRSDGIREVNKSK
jgi:hypothetical protein